MARVLRLDEAKSLSLPGRRSREIVSGATGADRLTLRIVEIAPAKPGEKQRGPHVHHAFEECIHVLAGEGLMLSDSGEHPLAAGDTMLVPAGERHVTYNVGSERLVLLCFFPVGDVASGTTEFPSWEAEEPAS